jgi:hypothetical protein
VGTFPNGNRLWQKNVCAVSVVSKIRAERYEDARLLHGFSMIFKIEDARIYITQIKLHGPQSLFRVFHEHLVGMCLVCPTFMGNANPSNLFTSLS